MPIYIYYTKNLTMPENGVPFLLEIKNNLDQLY